MTKPTFIMPMVDLRGQYDQISTDIDAAIRSVLDHTAFIAGPEVATFAGALSQYLGGCHVIPCANGTDALQIALMALDLHQGDQVIVPDFTYVASAEVIALLGLIPVPVDIDPDTFTIDPTSFEQAITPLTRAVIPVHLFGQSCDMDPILRLAERYHIAVIEDNAQSLGARYTFPDGHTAMTGTMGMIGCTSFFPTKPLGCYGDGGALFTSDETLAQRLRIIANHGQQVKYRHDIIGCNSRLDTLQAAILNAKLPHLDAWNRYRQTAADYYTSRLKAFDPTEQHYTVPSTHPSSTHIFHQYTIRVQHGHRDALRNHLAAHGIPSMIYYPLPIHEQSAFRSIVRLNEPLLNTCAAADSVLSLPIHTCISHSQQDAVIEAIISFFA